MIQILIQSYEGNNGFEVIPNYDIYPTVTECKKAIRWFEKVMSYGNAAINQHNEIARAERLEPDHNTADPRPVDRAGYIYILKSKNLYKIGRAKNLTERFKTYNTENPFGVEVILTKKVPDYVQAEKDLHEQFKTKRVSGEWFKLLKSDITTIYIKKQ